VDEVAEQRGFGFLREFGQNGEKREAVQGGVVGMAVHGHGQNDRVRRGGVQRVPQIRDNLVGRPPSLVPLPRRPPLAPRAGQATVRVAKERDRRRANTEVGEGMPRLIPPLTRKVAARPQPVGSRFAVRCHYHPDVRSTAHGGLDHARRTENLIVRVRGED